MEIQKMTENERVFENRIAIMERKTALNEERYKMVQENSDDRQKIIQAQFIDLRDLILQVKENIVEVKKSVVDLDQKFTWKFDEMDRKFGEVHRKFDEVNRKFDEVNHKFDEVNRKFDEVNHKFDEVNSKFDDQIKIMKSEFIWPVIIAFGSIFIASWFTPALNKWLIYLIP